MKRKIILIGIIISLSTNSFSQVLSDTWPDFIPITQEQFKVKQRLITGSVCLLGGATLICYGRQITRGKIETTIHPDNLFFPGYSFIGIGVVALISSYLQWQKIQLLIDEKGIGLVLRL